MTIIGTIRHDYGVTPVDTTTWQQLTVVLPSGATQSTLPADASKIEVFDSGGETMELGIGASGAQTRAAFIQPGGNSNLIQGPWSKGTTFWIRAVSATADESGSAIVINLYHGRG